MLEHERSTMWPPRGRLAKSDENNHPIHGSVVMGGYFLFSDRMDTINAPKASIIVIDSKTVIRQHLPSLLIPEKKASSTEKPIPYPRHLIKRN